MRKTAVTLVALLFAAACSTDEGAQLTPLSSPSGTGTGTELCELVASEEAPPELVAALPEEHRDAAQALVDLGAALDEAFDFTIEIDSDSDGTESDVAPAVPDELIASLTEPGVSDEFAAMADHIEEECGPSEEVEGIRTLSIATALAEPEADEEYCTALAAFIDADGDADAADAQIDELVAIAPESHADALESLRSLMDESFPIDDASVSEVAGVLSGLGLYAEARCEVEGAFALMLFAGSLANWAAEGSDGTGGADPSGDPADEPAVADTDAADAAVPTGSELTFEAGTVALEEGGDYLASLVVPAGWARSDFGLGAAYEPDAVEMGFFTEMSYDTGCDGVCQRTDWSARLNGPDGFLTGWVSDRDLIVNREIEGSEGVVLTTTSFSDGVEGLIARWDDGADRYFTCRFTLDEEDAGLADAFVAACEAARPGWFPVS